ncbi:MAG: hypothetical protein ACE15C_05565 [Phycisphaerae bacterium]
MASFKLNIARIQGCPPAAKLAAALEKYGLPEGDEFGVLSHSATSESAFATIIRRTQQTVQKLDDKSREVTSERVEKVTLYPFGVRPSSEVLEVYAGAAPAVEQVGIFFSSCLGLPTVVEMIELDIAAAISKLMKSTRKFILRSIRISDYAHNSYMSGPYAPKFLDSVHGLEFLEQYAEQVTSAAVKFATQTGRATATLTPKACFGYACKEEDQPEVQSVLRKLI